MEGQFTAALINNKIDFHSEYDINGYCAQFSGEQVSITIKLLSKQTEKERMYGYFYTAVLDATVQALTHDGWVGIDKVAAEEYLKMNCAKDIRYNPATDETMVYPISKSSMNKQRLLKFIVDSIHLLEERHNTKVTDSQEYKIWLETGEKIKIIK